MAALCIEAIISPMLTIMTLQWQYVERQVRTKEIKTAVTICMMIPFPDCKDFFRTHRLDCKWLEHNKKSTDMKKLHMINSRLTCRDCLNRGKVTRFWQSCKKTGKRGVKHLLQSVTTALKTADIGWKCIHCNSMSLIRAFTQIFEGTVLFKKNQFTWVIWLWHANFHG